MVRGRYLHAMPHLHGGSGRKVYFFKQPANADEEDAADRAMNVCPTGSIGSDGE
jgi:4Fe-4S single cluster domain of Ferredoxin I